MMSKKKSEMNEEIKEEIKEEAQMGAREETEEAKEENTEKCTEECQEGCAEESKEEGTELEDVKKELCEANERFLRVLAEYDNFRKRTLKERDELYKNAYVDCIKNMLPVIDNVERVLSLEGDEKFMAGLNLIVNQMHDSLEKMGVKEIECKVFDPNLHNAVMHIEDENYKEGEIVEVFQKGYIYSDKVIRYAMVKVAN